MLAVIRGTQVGETALPLVPMQPNARAQVESLRDGHGVLQHGRRIALSVVEAIVALPPSVEPQMGVQIPGGKIILT